MGRKRFCFEQYTGLNIGELESLGVRVQLVPFLVALGEGGDHSLFVFFIAHHGESQSRRSFAFARFIEVFGRFRYLRHALEVVLLGNGR
jgi:hypothetical protein